MFGDYETALRESFSLLVQPQKRNFNEATSQTITDIGQMATFDECLVQMETAGTAGANMNTLPRATATD